MARAAENVYEAIAKEGSQSSTIPNMQTRKELYEVRLGNVNFSFFLTRFAQVLGYEEYEKALDRLYPSATISPQITSAPDEDISHDETDSETKARDSEEEQDNEESEIDQEKIKDHGNRSESETKTAATKADKTLDGTPKRENEEAPSEPIEITADSAAKIEKDLEEGKEIEIK